MKRILIPLLLMISTITLAAGEKLSLKDCYRIAEDNYPLKKQAALQSNVSGLTIENLNTAYYPEITLAAQAQYQSEVTKVNLNLKIPGVTPPSIPVPPKDQYKIGLNINQLIWDGGMISGAGDVEKAQNGLNIQNIEVELYKLKDRVNTAYFNILILDKQIINLNILKSDLEQKLNNVKAGIKNGMVLESNADIINAELLKVGLNIEKAETVQKTAYQVLGDLLGKNIDRNYELTLPAADEPIPVADFSSRPEYRSFKLAQDLTDRRKSLADAAYMPKISAYGQAYYGKPGLNMFDPSFQPFFIVGVRGSWQLWNWDKTNREKQILDINKEIIKSNEETLTKNLNIAVKQYLNMIDYYQNAINKDNKIITLRGKIAKETSVQLDNGVITATEYITEKNAEAQARLNLEIHKLELLKSKIDYLTTVGSPVE